MLPSLPRSPLFGLWAPGLLTLTFAVSVHGGLPPQEEARQALRRVWAEEQGLTRLRAGEAMALAGEAEVVRASLLAADPASFGSPARVVALRVLTHAAADTAERTQRIAQLRAIFLDLAAPDRLHALESLAKLGVRLEGSDLEAVRTWVAGSTEAAQPFGQWMLHLAGDPSAAPALVAALGSRDPVARLRAAFALRMIRPSDGASRAAVAAALAAEAADSPARPYLLSAALRLEADPARIDGWRDEAQALFAERGRGGAILELAPVLTHLRTAPPPAVFLALLQHADADARIGGAKALLAQNLP